MPLSTQLIRGALALPLLLAFAGLGIVASQQSDFDRVGLGQASIGQVTHIRALAEIAAVVESARTVEIAAVAQSARAVEMARTATAATPALEHLSRLCAASTRNRALVLAQAPADLGNLAIRWGQACRA